MALPDARPFDLVIFDCDGVLVDSEGIAQDLLRRTLLEQGLELSADTVREQFQGRSLSAVQATLRALHGVTLPAQAVDEMGRRLLARFSAGLRPVDGMAALVDGLTARACVASSSSRERLHHALAVTGLADRFAGAIFSADDVRRGKPAPDLFLHAARMCGTQPIACVVVEDSPAGLEGARRAGMAAIGFTGGSHAGGADYADTLVRAGAHAVAANAHELAALLPR